MRRRPGAVLLRGIVGLAVGATVLNGCAAKEAASTSLPATTSKSAPTTAALPPLGPPDFPVPAAARTKDAAGAEAFARYWISLLNRERAIPSGQPLRDLGPQCEDCLRIAHNYDTAAAAGHKYEGGELKVNDLPPVTVRGDMVMVSFGLRQEAVRLLDKSGRVVDPGLPVAPNASSGCNLIWSPSSESWLIKDFTIG